MFASDPVLDAILAPLAKHYASSDVIEMRVSRPQKVTIEKRGQSKLVDVEDETLTVSKIEYINQTLSNRYALSFDPNNNPKISCILPNGHRYESLVGASSESGLNVAIRCKHPFKACFADYGLSENHASLINEYVQEGKHILISGGTNTGKTTLLNLLIDQLPKLTRLVLAQDTPEIDHKQFDDCSSLLAGRGTDSPSMLNWPSLYDHLNRITPDRVIFGEISTDNAFSALSVLNSGASGFMCTIHAESPMQVINHKFDQVVAMSGRSMPQVKEYLGELVDMIIQIKRREGKRYISEIYLPKEKVYVLGGDA